ncbi:MAG: glycosyltransferase family 4 protein [Bacteroidetes bacterium]|nr:glycosyltransferase family 4 protein [Bacteroidota bacterium]
MKVLMVLVGTPILERNKQEKIEYLERYCLELGSNALFERKEIINADNQRKSLVGQGINVDYVFLGARRHPKSLFNSGRILRKLVKKEKYDLVHSMWGTTTGLVCTIFSPVPTVVSFCGSDLLGNYTPEGKQTKGGRLSSFISKIDAVLAKAIIAKSEHLKNSLWSSTRSKVTVIPNGIDPAKFYPIDRDKARHELGWSLSKKVVLLFKGGGAYVKNLPLAEKAFEMLNVENKELFYIEGIPFERLVYYYNAADVMFLTSLHEGSNNSIKEAMACNLPIVTSAVGDAPERLENVKNSAVIKSYRAEDFAHAAESILANGQRSNGKDFIHEITEQAVANKIANYYKKILTKA